MYFVYDSIRAFSASILRFFSYFFVRIGQRTVMVSMEKDITNVGMIRRISPFAFKMVNTAVITDANPIVIDGPNTYASGIL